MTYAQQGGSSAWLSVDYTYSDLTYKEPTIDEKGRLAGIRGELGLGLTSWLGISVGGEYQDGNLNYDGSTFGGAAVKQVTKDYIRDTRAMLHWLGGPAILSAGIGQREWYDDLVVSYRRRTTYNYYPITLTLNRDNVYVKFENDVWNKGHNKSYMHDVNAAEKDVEFTQSSGSGYGLEIGYAVATADRFISRVFISYHRFDVGDSDVQNDNVYNLQEPKNNMVTIQGGIGFLF